MQDDLLLTIYNRPETVLTLGEMAQLVPHISEESLRDRLYYFAKVGKIRRLRQGIYAKANYNPFELANKIYRPSYISLETVLCSKGIIFQEYSEIFCTSYVTRKIMVDGKEICYRQVKGVVLTNLNGIKQVGGYTIATTERAFLDAVNIYKDYHFDNLSGLKWNEVMKLLPIYQSLEMNKRVERYRAQSLEANAKFS